MRRSLVIVVAVALALVLVSVVVFAVALSLSPIDALYFAVTTVTTVGYGDISLAGASPTVKLFGIVVMVAGPAAMAATFGIVTDALLRARLEQLFGKRIKTMKDHVVLCGLGNVGVRVLERMHALDEPMVVVEKDEQRRFLGQARSLGVPVVLGDMRMPETLAKARVEQAKCIIACTQDDLANLEAGLAARAVQPDIRVVLRMFNQTLARRLEDTMGITVALSTSSLAAPAFAMAALEQSVEGSFAVDDELWLSIRVEIGPDHPWRTRSLASLAAEDGVSALAIHRGSQRLTPPSSDETLREGDVLVGCLPSSRRRDLPS